MTVSNITNTSSTGGVGQSNWKSTIQQGREDFQQLLQAMQAGDVSAAQQSYAAIQQLTSPASGSSTGSDTTAAPSTASTTGGNAVLTDWNQLGQALQSGNLSSAQSAFSQLQQDAQAAASQGHHHHHHAINQAQSVYSAMGNDGDGDDKVAATGATGTAGATGTTGATGRGALQSDLSAAQQALQSGDTQAAQNLLAKLQQDLMASGHHRHWANAASTASSANGTSTATAATAAA